ncbi:MAG: Cytochrome c551 peroxidase [Myxococcota bacterium]|nr:Cytochrome c551 peroxidase [Myxococcota bacterium]
MAMARWMVIALVLAVETLPGCGADAPADAGVSPDGAPAAAFGQTIAGVELTEAELENIRQMGPLPALPPDPSNRFADDERAARLGQILFFDRRLSSNGEVSCASCHKPERGFAEEKPLANTIAPAQRHTPSVLNTAHQRWQFWDGRADSLWSQALGPIENPVEMGFTRMEAVRLISTNPALRARWVEVFGPPPDFSDNQRFPPRARPNPLDSGDPLEKAWRSMAEADRQAVNSAFANLGKAIAAYERKLVTGPAPIDLFVAAIRTGAADGLKALPAGAVRGLKLFAGKGQCFLCHTGPLFSDLEFHNLKLKPRPGMNPGDMGRHAGVQQLLNDPFNVTGPYSDSTTGPAAERLRFLKPQEEDRGQYKTPILRNVALTAPYMHGGHFATLKDVVRFYSTLNEEGTIGHRENFMQPLNFSESELDSLVAFLESLTGEPPPREWTTPPPGP